MDSTWCDWVGTVSLDIGFGSAYSVADPGRKIRSSQWQVSGDMVTPSDFRCIEDKS